MITFKLPLYPTPIPGGSQYTDIRQTTFKQQIEQYLIKDQRFSKSSEIQKKIKLTKAGGGVIVKPLELGIFTKYQRFVLVMPSKIIMIECTPQQN